MNKVRMLLASAALVATTAAVSAVPVTIDFGSGSGKITASEFTFSGGGYTVTATGQTVDGAGNKTGDALLRKTGSPVNGPNEGGLGVLSPNDTNQSIDGNGLKEMLLLTFNKAVRIVGISFSRVDARFGGDNAVIKVDGTSAGTFAVDSFGWPKFMNVNFTGTTLGIGAAGKADEFKVRAIQVSPVPVPPAMVLLASGLVGIGALARRRNKRV